MEFLKNAINFISDPRYLIVIAAVFLFVSLKYPQKFYTNKSAIIVFGFMFIFLGVSVFNPYFYKIVTKPDNVPIVGILFLVPFFTWFSFRESVRNDQRAAERNPLIDH